MNTHPMAIMPVVLASAAFTSTVSEGLRPSDSRHPLPTPRAQFGSGNSRRTLRHATRGCGGRRRSGLPSIGGLGSGVFGTRTLHGCMRRTAGHAPDRNAAQQELGIFSEGALCAHSFLDGVRYWGGLPAQHEIRSADCGWYNCTRRSDGLNTVTVVRAHVIRREGLRPCSSSICSRRFWARRPP